VNSFGKARPVFAVGSVIAVTVSIGGKQSAFVRCIVALSVAPYRPWRALVDWLRGTRVVLDLQIRGREMMGDFFWNVATSFPVLAAPACTPGIYPERRNEIAMKWPKQA
jgi:hypothetical protein